MKKQTPHDRLKYHVTGAIERGEAKAIKAVLPRRTYIVNTDNVDIFKRQIGIGFAGTIDREFGLGVNHLGTPPSVREATAIANDVAAFLNLESPTDFLASAKGLVKWFDECVATGYEHDDLCARIKAIKDAL